MNGSRLPFDIVKVDAQNHRSLVAGTWTISGTSLTTAMTTLDDVRTIRATIRNETLVDDDAQNVLKFQK